MKLLDVLDYLHTQDPPIIHRDVKPSNLKLRQNDTLVLVDFGIAKEYSPEGDAFSGATAVTPGFSPAEQYSARSTDARSDVYSVGATLYFLLTGKAPAAAPDRVSGAVTLLPVSQLASNISQATDMMVRKALNLASDGRWANAAEMRRAALAASRKLVGAAPSPPLPPVSPPPVTTGGGRPAPQAGKRPLGLAAVAALAGVALLAAAALFWMTSARGSDETTLADPAPSRVVATVGRTHTPLVTDTPVTPTLAPTALAQATATAPANQAGSAALGPTSTPIPTRTPSNQSRTPTATLIKQQDTPAPAATAPPATATPSTVEYSAVALRSPDEGASFYGAKPGITFQWDSAGVLAEDSYYVVTILFPHSAETWQDVQWTKQTVLSIPDYLHGAATLPGVLRWNVVVKRQTGTQPDGQKQGVELGPRSATRSFNWAPGDAGSTGGGSGNTGGGSDPGPPPTRTPEPPPP